MFHEYDSHVLQTLHDERYDRLARYAGRPRRMGLRSAIWQRFQAHGAPHEMDGH